MSRDADTGTTPRWWRRLREPSLVRGLMAAQALLVCLLWGGLALMSMADERTGRELERAAPAMTAILATAEALQDRPQALRHILEQVDELNQASADADGSDAMLRMSLWRGADRLYTSGGLPDALHSVQPEGLHEVELDGVKWLVFTLRAMAPSGLEPLDLSFIVPRPSSVLTASLGVLGSLVQPLLISLPLLLLPAWLSVRWALRPWRHLSAEVASRDAQDLSPLMLPSRAQELRPLVTALNHLLAQLREARERERRFVADAAHELRTPLTALGVYAETLQPLTTAPAAQTVLAGMLRSKERAVRLVNQLLALMRSEAEAQGARQRLNLAVLVPELLAEMAPLAHVRHVVLECDADTDDLWLFARPEGLHTLFANLVENAIKYGPTHGCVRLHLWRENSRLYATVVDQGPGITLPWRAEAMKRFTRLPGQTQPGSGLGLAIAHSVMQELGCGIELDDAPGGGLLVRLWWPAAPTISGDIGPASA